MQFDCKKNRHSFIHITALTLAVLLGAPVAATTFFVDGATGDDMNNDGLLWSSAFKTPQKALDAAEAEPNPPHEIWVAEGTYRPDQGGGQASGDRAASFQLIAGVSLFGGFPTGVKTSQPTAMLWQPISDNTPPPCCVGSQNQGEWGPACSSALRDRLIGPIAFCWGANCASAFFTAFM